MKQHLARVGALIGAAALISLSIGPAAAAETVSQASANGLTLNIAGSPFSSGTVKATNNGNGEKVTGEVNPPVDVLGNQDVLDIGVIAQDATAKVENRRGVSRACAGVAGDGASVAEVGESNCLTPGDPVGITIANLDLTGTVVVDPESALGALDPVLQTIMDQLLAPLTASLTDALEAYETTGLTGTLGAVQSRCVADPDSAEGTANLADTKLTLDVAGTTIDLVEFPASPDPNTKVVTDLDEVLNTIIEALEVDLTNTLDGLAGGLTVLTDALQEQIVDTLVAEVADQLAPLEENILDATLNKQTKSEGGKKIEVTALDLRLLPAAEQFGAPSVLTIELASVSCGPNARVAGPDDDDDSDDDDSDDDSDGDDSDDDVPTTVDAGASNSGVNQAALVGGLLMLGGAAGLIGYRRLLGR